MLLLTTVAQEVKLQLYGSVPARLLSWRPGWWQLNLNWCRVELHKNGNSVRCDRRHAKVKGTHW